MSAKECRYCSLPVTRPRTGRPPDYCSVGCRRASEYDLRRMSRRLESLERQRDELEMLIAIEEVESLGEWQRKKHTLQAETVARQIARDRDRLRLLLDDHDGKQATGA